MKKLNKLLLSLMIAALMTNLAVPFPVSAATGRYGMILGDNDNNYKLYNNLIVTSPSGNLMVKAYNVSKGLGLYYSYNKAVKKLTIKNTNNGKSLVFAYGSRNYTYYSGSSSQGLVKTAAYKFYYDSSSQCYVVHAATLKYILGYNYYKDLNDYYSKMGYKSLVVYSINGYSSYDIPITDEVITYINAKTYTSKDELLDAVRMNLMMRKSGVTFTTNRSVMNQIGSSKTILDLAESIDDKDTSKDADYLSRLINNFRQSWSVSYIVRTEPDGTRTNIESPDDVAKLTIDVNYETTLAQERVVDSKVASTLKSLKLTGSSDYDKVKKIHDYIINSAKYDTSYQKYSAYDMFIYKTAVCEGYALTAYRLFVDAGLESRIITGTGKGQAHAWNLVKVDGQWYNIDLTWDDPITNTGEQVLRYDYFLKSTADFKDHVRAAEYNTAEFQAEYPIAAQSHE
ncbi:MAG TPA: transglutaminase domain-containing protein [Mobilitalea sp.]|nr:transglutaminase domain-containing protein [Mobilitalea sp.]